MPDQVAQTIAPDGDHAHPDIKDELDAIKKRLDALEMNTTGGGTGGGPNGAHTHPTLVRMILDLQQQVAGFHPDGDDPLRDLWTTSNDRLIGWNIMSIGEHLMKFTDLEGRINVLWEDTYLEQTVYTMARTDRTERGNRGTVLVYKEFDVAGRRPSVNIGVQIVHISHIDDDDAAAIAANQSYRLIIARTPQDVLDNNSDAWLEADIGDRNAVLDRGGGRHWKHVPKGMYGVPVPENRQLTVAVSVEMEYDNTFFIGALR